MSARFFQVDAFTRRPFGGNPAGVIVSDSPMTRETMQLLSREVNASETAFVFPDLDFRFFTPSVEISYCGHATLAAFHAMITTNVLSLDPQGSTYTQKTREGTFTVNVFPGAGSDNPVICTKQQQATMKDILPLNALNDLFYLPNSELKVEEVFCLTDDAGVGLTPQVADTGLSDVMVPVRHSEFLMDLVPRYDNIELFSRRHNVVGLHLFTFKGPRGGDLAVRNFAPLVGINEEAATGSANGALAAYLAHRGAVQYGTRLSIDQGDSLHRPSRLYVNLGENHRQELTVEGTCVTIFSGEVNPELY